jgi:hypothetical protein
LGDATEAEVVRVEWPSGEVQEFSHLPADQILTITEPAALKAIRFLPADGFDLQLIGNVGSQYDLYTSNDLRHWALWQSNVATNRSSVIRVSAGVSAGHTFYKAQLHE